MLLIAGMIGFTAPAAEKIGDAAPKIEGVTIVKGKAISGFEKGKVYVVEFWATWCPPCLKSIPHLTTLQKKYGDKVVILGISSEKEKTVKTFVTKQGAGMDYIVALDTQRKMNAAYMKAFKQRGIPTAFIVDKNGKIAWVGHPMGMDKKLDSIVNQK